MKQDSVDVAAVRAALRRARETREAAKLAAKVKTWEAEGYAEATTAARLRAQEGE